MVLRDKASSMGQIEMFVYLTEQKKWLMFNWIICIT